MISIMKETIYCESICTALAEVRKTCGEEIYNKILGCLPNLTKSVGQEKISKYMNTALLTVENIQSANKPTNGNIDRLNQEAEFLERCYYDSVMFKNGKQFWEHFIALIGTEWEEKIRKEVYKEVYFDFPFDMSVLYGKEVPSLSQIIKELITIDPKLDYVILLKCAKEVFYECYDSEFEVYSVNEYGELHGYYWPIVPEGFANLFRQDLIHAVKKRDLTIFNKLLCSLPLLKSLPKFTYKPQRLMNQD
jgi:hypothetical protein